MSLDPLHEELARLALSLPEAGPVALAGGGAMLAHGLVARPTQDLDLFTPDPDDVVRLADALAVALRADGARVTIDRRDPGFARMVVTMPDGRAVAVEVAHDARIRDTVRLAFGPVLHPDEVAADKTLALFGRAAARDLVDVDALQHRYTRDQLFALAAEKDPGFDPGVFADALAAAARHSDAAFAELGLDAAATVSLRARADQWRRELRPEPGPTLGASRDRTARGYPGSTTPTTRDEPPSLSR
ncbi:MAG: nucleotidyl transferase AbiEii/AbiGii toxin family protein [Actinomycetes bacterium]